MSVNSMERWECKQRGQKEETDKDTQEGGTQSP